MLRKLLGRCNRANPRCGNNALSNLFFRPVSTSPYGVSHSGLPCLHDSLVAPSLHHGAW
jgi:hypothetical protein